MSADPVQRIQELEKENERLEQRVADLEEMVRDRDDTILRLRDGRA